MVALRDSAVTLLLLVALASPVGAQVRVSVRATGVATAGGPAPAELVLGNVLQTDVADVFAEIQFEPELLSLDFDNCTISEDIESSHVLEGDAASDAVQLDVVSNPQPAILPAGALVTCVFDVLPGVPAGTAGLTLANVRAVDPEGGDVDVIGLDGFILIAEGTPVPTRTVGPTFTVRSASAPSDCSVVPPGQAHPLGSWLLLGGAALLLVRRCR